MNTTAQTIDLETLPITVTYVGEIVSPWDDKQARTVDQWQVKLTSKSGFWTTAYYTGTGLRKARNGQKNPYPPRSIAAEAWNRDNLKPAKPTNADILHSLTMDASAADENFSDWCANFGYSDDSLKALNTYKQCLEIATALRKHFDRATLEAIREAVADH
jgi:hypothetical protein